MDRLWTLSNWRLKFCSKLRICCKNLNFLPFDIFVGMYNSDVVLAWFSPDSTENFVDAHVAPSGLHKPIVDVYQNWKKIYMSQENGFTTLIFTRKLKICGQGKFIYFFKFGHLDKYYIKNPRISDDVINIFKKFIII